VKIPILVLLVAGLLVGCKPETFNDQQLAVEKKLVEMSIDTLFQAIELCDIQEIRDLLTDQAELRYVYADTILETASPEELLESLRQTRHNGYAITLGMRQNQSILVSRSGELATATYEVMANITARDTVETVQFVVNHVMTRERGCWKVTSCCFATPEAISGAIR